MSRRKVPTRRLESRKAIAAELDRAAQRDYRERLKARIVAIRQQVKAVKQAEKLALLQVRDLCRRSRARARARAHERRIEVLKLLREETAAFMAEARRACAKRTGNVQRRSARARAKLEEQAKALARELAADRLYREFQTGGPSKRRSSRTEHRQESDDEVRRNLEPDLVPVFDSVRRTIHGSPKRSRTETFLQWVEENPDEVLTMRAELGDRAFQRELKEHLEHEKQIGRLLKRKGRIKASELEAVGLSPSEVASVGLDPGDPGDVRSFLEGSPSAYVEEEAPF